MFSKHKQLSLLVNTLSRIIRQQVNKTLSQTRHLWNGSLQKRGQNVDTIHPPFPAPKLILTPVNGSERCAVPGAGAAAPFWALCVCSSICLSLSISSSFSRSIRSFSFSACSRFFFSFSSCALEKWEQRRSHTQDFTHYMWISWR